MMRKYDYEDIKNMLDNDIKKLNIRLSVINVILNDIKINKKKYSYITKRILVHIEEILKKSNIKIRPTYYSNNTDWSIVKDLKFYDEKLNYSFSINLERIYKMNIIYRDNYFINEEDLIKDKEKIEKEIKDINNMKNNLKNKIKKYNKLMDEIDKFYLENENLKNILVLLSY